MGHIEIRQLSKAYGGVDALIDLDLTVEDGEFVTLLGPSGCGKTTTLNLLAGFLEPDGGSITIDGRLVSAPGRRVEPEARGMGMVFQSYALWPHKSVFANVAYGLQRQRLGRAAIRTRVAEMLDVVGLSGYGDRYPDQLSGGQQQRVALARSLITQPAILLLDEPLSNLDAKLRESMRSEVQRIQRQLRTTFVYVTHDQVEAMSMSDRVAVLDKGRLRQYAPPREIYLDPANAFVVDFMGLVNFLPATATTDATDGSVTVRLSADPQCDLSGKVAPGTGEIRAGDRVMVGARPETLGVVEGRTEAPHVVGAVKRSMLLGNITQHFVEVGDQTLRVQTDHTVTVEPGAEVVLVVSAPYARVFSMPDADPVLRAK